MKITRHTEPDLTASIMALRVTPEMERAVRALAKRDGCTVSDVLRAGIELLLQREGK